MEPIEEYLRNLHKKNSPHDHPREPAANREEHGNGHEEGDADPHGHELRNDAANAPTTELPTVVATLRNNEPSNAPQRPIRAHSSRSHPTRRNRHTRKRPRRYDLMIIAAGVAVVAVIVGIAFFPRGSGRTVANDAPRETLETAPHAAPRTPNHTAPKAESAHDAVIRLCNERALAFSTTDEELLRSLTVDGSPARKAEKFADIHKYGGADIAIDATDIDVVKETSESAVVTATVTAHPQTGVRLTLTLKKVDKRWRVWEVTE